MKEEPFPVANPGDGDDDDGGGNGGMFMEESSQFPAPDEDMDIKHEFPIVVTNPLLDLELDMEPGPTSPRPTGLTGEELIRNPNSGFYLNENDEDDDDDGDGTQAELEEINAIINGGEVDVQEVKPIAIPIPISMPAHLASNERIINYTKPRPKGQKAKPKPCICTICHTGFPSQQLFQLHMSDVHADERPFRCSHCGKGFAKAKELGKHETIHDPNRFKGEPKFACDLCDKKYHIKGSLEGHRKLQHLGYKKTPRRSEIVTKHHAIGVRNHQPQKKEVRVFKCPYCDLKFAMRCLVRKHLICHSKERPYQCPQCDQRCATKSTLRVHIRNRHLNPSTNSCPSRPKYMSNQPCPCTVCGKVFKVPSQLQKHFRVHSGEKPYECPVCGQRFSLRQSLRKHERRLHETPKGQVNDNLAYKCLICGKGGLLLYSDLRNHRIHVHRHIPMPEDSDKERPFACGICGKPYNTKGQAMVCAILKHDPKSLLAAMFKYKCPGCPEERFGYHSTFALRKHWEKEHVDKPLPVQYRAPSGMYENREEDANPLPSVTVSKELARRIRENGPDVKYEYPLYVEFDLLPVAGKFYREVTKGRKRKSGPSKPPEINFTCNICGATIVQKRNFKRHMQNHNRVGGGSNSKYSCDVCEKRFRELKTLQLHQRRHKYVLEGGGVNSHYNCDVCGKRFGKMKTLRLHQRQHKLKTAADAPAPIKRRPGRPPKRQGSLVGVKITGCLTGESNGSGNFPEDTATTLNVADVPPATAVRRGRGRPPKCHSKLELIASANTFTKLNNFPNNATLTVNVKDTTAIRNILGNRIASIVLPRVNDNRQQTNSIDSSNFDFGSHSKQSNGNVSESKSRFEKVIRIVLKRVDS